MQCLLARPSYSRVEIATRGNDVLASVGWSAVGPAHVAARTVRHVSNSTNTSNTVLASGDLGRQRVCLVLVETHQALQGLQVLDVALFTTEDLSASCLPVAEPVDNMC